MGRARKIKTLEQVSVMPHELNSVAAQLKFCSALYYSPVQNLSNTHLSRRERLFSVQTATIWTVVVLHFHFEVANKDSRAHTLAYRGIAARIYTRKYST